MKGIDTAGGPGTRLYPLPMVTSKQLLPIYDKPMIYLSPVGAYECGHQGHPDYPTRRTCRDLEILLGDGNQFGISLSYNSRPSPRRTAQAFIIGEEFIGDDSVWYGPGGDNIFAGHGLKKRLKAAVENAETARGSDRIRLLCRRSREIRNCGIRQRRPCDQH